MLPLHLTRRIGTGLFIGVIHLILAAALLHHANRSRPDDAGPVEYMSYIVPKPTVPDVAAPVPAPPVSVRRMRAPSVAVDSAPVARSVATAEPHAAQAAQEAQAVQAEQAEQAAPAAPAASSPLPSSARLDMVALRADAGRIASGYVPEPFEQVRNAERRLEAEKNDLGRAIAKTKRPPCSKKYSGGTKLNLILLIPLAIDTITDTGCKW